MPCDGMGYTKKTDTEYTAAGNFLCFDLLLEFDDCEMTVILFFPCICEALKKRLHYL
jgi:hypothetical protein